MTAPATINAAFDDFDAWEAEVSQSRNHRPTRAAERRADRAAIHEGLGLRRHRSREREA